MVLLLQESCTILQDLQNLASLARFLQDKDPFSCKTKYILQDVFYWKSTKIASTKITSEEHASFPNNFCSRIFFRRARGKKLTKKMFLMNYHPIFYGTSVCWTRLPVVQLRCDQLYQDSQLVTPFLGVVSNLGTRLDQFGLAPDAHLMHEPMHEPTQVDPRRNVPQPYTLVTKSVCM